MADEGSRDTDLRQSLDRVDARITAVLARTGVPALRLGLGVVFLWFGMLKFIPDRSPAADIATGRSSACRRLATLNRTGALPPDPGRMGGADRPRLADRALPAGDAAPPRSSDGRRPHAPDPVSGRDVHPVPDRPDARGPVHHQEHSAHRSGDGRRIDRPRRWVRGSSWCAGNLGAVDGRADRSCPRAGLRPGRLRRIAGTTSSGERYASSTSRWHSHVRAWQRPPSARSGQSPEGIAVGVRSGGHTYPSRPGKSSRPDRWSRCRTL